MPPPTFRIGYAAALIGPYTYAAHDAAAQIPPNYYCKVELQSLAGVDSIAVTLPSADPTTLAAGLPVVTVDQSTKTATWRHPNATGRSLNVQVKINNGVDGDGTVVAGYTRELQTYSVTSTGLVMFAVGETDQYHRTYGHTQKHNSIINASHSATVIVNSANVSQADRPKLKFGSGLSVADNSVDMLTVTASSDIAWTASAGTYTSTNGETMYWYLALPMLTAEGIAWYDVCFAYRIDGGSTYKHGYYMGRVGVIRKADGTYVVHDNSTSATPITSSQNYGTTTSYNPTVTVEINAGVPRLKCGQYFSGSGNYGALHYDMRYRPITSF